MTGALTIRQYREGDAERVRELHEVAMRDVGAYIEGAPEPDLDDPAAAYLDSGGEFLVGTLDGHIVAMGAFREPTWYITDLVDCGDATAELKRLRVDPDHQRRGFGAAILDGLTERAREMGYESFVLDTTPGQTGAQRFFETHGFRRIGRERIEGPDGAIELLLYRGRLEDR